MTREGSWQHPQLTRRTALQAGAIGLLGLGINHLAALRHASSADGRKPSARARSCIFIFLSGGLSQLDSFDLKPDAPEDVRGEFRPIATRTPGLQICEHLPLLAERSHLWAVVRSLTHPSNEHSAGHLMMLTGRTPLPPGFQPNAPQPGDWPSIAAVATYATTPRNNLPPAAVLPEKLVHYSGRIIPGQFAGQMGRRFDPWFIEASPFHSTRYGAYPEYSFDHQQRDTPETRLFQAPHLSLPHGLGLQQFRGRLELRELLARQQRALDSFAQTENFDHYRQMSISLLTDARVQRALDVTRAPDKVQDRYGRNSFGWSLLMARNLIAEGVNLVQVNLGNDETWDTHGNAFPHLKNKLFPPTDRAVAALLDDLAETGLLDETLIVMASEFGRTPKISLLPQHYKLPGRDHWGAVQSIWLAGAGVPGGTAVGASDRIGAYPVDTPLRPENLAATIYDALGIPREAVWHDDIGRPHAIYHGDPIFG